MSIWPANRSLTGRALRRRIVPTVAASTVLLTCATVAPTPSAKADEVDDLIQSMEETSQAASAKSEEVKALRIEVDDAQSQIDALNQRADDANRAAQDASQKQTDHQGSLDGIAHTRYTNSTLQRLTTAMAAGTPQNAIDRTAYLTVLSHRAESEAQGLAAATSDAARLQQEAAQAVAQATFRKNIRERQLKELEQEEADLHQQIDDLERSIGDLSPEQREAWENKNGPMDPNLDGVEGSESGMAAVQAALSKLGSPYDWGAAGPSEFDCSGLMFWAYQQQGKTIPRTSQAQLSGGQSVSSDELEPGDIVAYYPGATHVGMYIGNGQVVHASDYGIPVQVVAVDSMPIVGASRY